MTARRTRIRGATHPSRNLTDISPRCVTPKTYSLKGIPKYSLSQTMMIPPEVTVPFSCSSKHSRFPFLTSPLRNSRLPARAPDALRASPLIIPYKCSLVVLCVFLKPLAPLSFCHTWSQTPKSIREMHSQGKIVQEFFSTQTLPYLITLQCSD